MALCVSVSPRRPWIGALAETPIHPGAGQSGGTIDLPVAREGGTDYPFVPGSSNKGSTKQQAGGDPDLYGSRDKQGSAMFGDLRLLLLPLRSSHGAYKWATCPHLLERLKRDLERARYGIPLTVPASMAAGTVEATEDIGVRLLLEEMTFTVQNPLSEDVIRAVERLIPSEPPYDTTRARLKRQLLIMPDDDFAWFARFALPVHAHNVLKKETKTSGNLWYEETLPADTLLYSIAAPRSGATDAAAALKDVLDRGSAGSHCARIRAPPSPDAGSAPRCACFSWRVRGLFHDVKTTDALPGGFVAAELEPLLVVDPARRLLAGGRGLSVHDPLARARPGLGAAACRRRQGPG